MILFLLLIHRHVMYSKGTFRLAFLFDRPDIANDAFVLKPTLFAGHHDMDDFFREQMYAVPMEVAILEGLTASPRITDIYGYCGMTTMQEVLPEEILTLLEPEGHTANQTKLDMLQAVDGKVHPKNNLTGMEKLDLALGMAEAVADIHGFKGGVIVHGDLHPSQFMKNRQGQVKMNDFNLGSILEWNEREQTYCPREKDPWCYECRAPEEMFGIPFDEKIDVFTFGNAIYAMVSNSLLLSAVVACYIVIAKFIDAKITRTCPRIRKAPFASSNVAFYCCRLIPFAAGWIRSVVLCP
jgi:serine/threonine protein kinase